MNPKSSEYTSRLLCEGWVEKQMIVPNLSTTKQNKPKSRFATLTLFSGGIEIRFYPKTPKHCKELIQEKVTLLPWKYCVHMEVNTNKSYQLILKVFDDGFSSPCTAAIQMSMRSLEEATVWMKCTQGLTKLPSGCEENKFTVKTTRTKVFQQLGAAEMHCILHFSKDVVKLALKSDLTIIAIWPIMFIRSYSSQSANSFSITAGRRSPMGEATYDFTTLEMDGNKLFQILDYYTGVTERLPQIIKPQCTKSMQTKHAVSLPASRQSPSRPAIRNAKTDQDIRPLASPPPKPPRKPTMTINNLEKFTVPQGRTPVPKQRHMLLPPKKDSDADLDKLLNSLEHSLGMDTQSKNSVTVTDHHTEECRELLNELLSKVCNSKSSGKSEASYSSVDFSRKSLKKKKEASKGVSDVYF